MGGLELLSIPGGTRCNYYKYIAFLNKGVDRDHIKQKLREKWGVSLSGEVYEIPCHLQPVFKGLSNKGDFPVSEDLCQRMVCLPISAVMTEEEALYVIDSLRKELG